MSWSLLPSARSLRAWALLVSGEPLCHLHLLRSAKTDVVYSPKRCDDRLNQPRERSRQHGIETPRLRPFRYRRPARWSILPNPPTSAGRDALRAPRRRIRGPRWRDLRAPPGRRVRPAIVDQTRRHPGSTPAGLKSHRRYDVPAGSTWGHRNTRRPAGSQRCGARFALLALWHTRDGPRATS